jgi:Ca2+-binding RTX toxin-like protein
MCALPINAPWEVDVKVRRAVAMGVPMLVAAFVAVPFTPAGAGTHQWTFPGADCPTTLQACIDGADPGDTILLDTNDTIMEDLSITRSLTLRGAQGFLPAVQYVNVVGDGSGDALAVTIQDLGITFDLFASFTGGTGHTLTVRHVDVEQSSMDSTDPAMALQASVPATFTITRSTIHGGRSDFQLSPIEVRATQPDGEVVLRATGNHVLDHGDPQSAGGILVDAAGTGVTEADLYGNSIWSVAQCNCGSAAGINLQSSDAGVLVANVVGNTIDRSAGDGLAVSDESAAEGHVSLAVFDNVLSRTGTEAVRLSTAVASTLSYLAGHNDLFANGEPSELGGHSAGAGNLSSNPAFVDETNGNLALKATSPLVDAGVVCTPGGLANLDAAGHGRLFGPSVDMGAFERGAGAPTGKALVGTPAADSLVGGGGADIACGLGGDDVLIGAGGADYLDGGGGADSIIGGAGADRLFGGAGDDLCLSAHDGVKGNDSVDGGPGTDRFTADDGDQLVRVERRGGCDA